MEGAVYLSGLLVVVSIAAVFYFLAHESKYAFDRKFSYGYRFALQDPHSKEKAELAQDVNASVLAAHPDGEDGLDAKEEGIGMPTLEMLAGSAKFGTGTSFSSELKSAKPGDLYRDDWRSAKRAEKGDTFLLYAFATPEFKGSTMSLAWEPDEGFDPASTPYAMTLACVQAPPGVDVNTLNADLLKKPSGRIEVPAYVARTDDDRTKGYVFRVEAKPTKSNFLATIGGLFRTDWGPTLAHPRFGFVPLLLGTLLITLLAMVMAAPLGIATAVYLGEFAPLRLREWLKPVIELLASIPTVVLGYFGLMLVAPAFQAIFASGTGMESGRNMLVTSVVMAVLLIPTIATVAEDALRAVPVVMRDGAIAIGMTMREMVKLVVLPGARAGVIAACLLGIARALGETMIVWILSGGTPNMPALAMDTLTKPTRGIPDTVAIEMGNVDFEGVHYGHLFLLGLILFSLTLVINLVGNRMARRAAWRM